MNNEDSPSSTLESSSDTSRLLKELMDLQKSTASSRASIDRSLTHLHDSHEHDGGTGSGGATTEPTLAELMRTMYDGTVPRQLITLQGTDTANSFTVYGQEVDIVSSKLSGSMVSQASSTGSNKVKITPVVNYDWEHKFYVGSLVAIHRSNEYAAYVLKGKGSGVVRIVNRCTAERTLLKDFNGRVIDLAFAHTEDALLAVVDEKGNLFVYEAREGDDKKIVTTVLLHVKRPVNAPSSEYHRVIWCPFIPDDNDDSIATDSTAPDASRVLVLTSDEKAEIWSIDMVTKDRNGGPIDVNDVEQGLIVIDNHTKPIIDAAFSPDGTALATASLDGEVKFFQVYMNEGTSPRCLHQWQPHDGKPMSCLFFLDDHKNFNFEAQFWKFAVTGANNNQEIKIWSCESWNCLQTIRFLSPLTASNSLNVEPCMKASLDLSARYLVLSDVWRKVIYVLQIFQDGAANTAHVGSVSEFLLAQPCLSFAILDASTKKFKKITGDDSHLDEITTGEIDQGEGEDEDLKTEETASKTGVQIKLYTVHPKTLQELLIRFKPESAVAQPTPSVSTISHEESGIRDALSDMSMSVDGTSVDGASKMEAVFNGQEDTAHVLIPPGSFTFSPRKQHFADDSMNEHVRMSASSTSSFTQVTAMNEEFMSPRSSSGGSTLTHTPSHTPHTPSHTPSSSHIDPASARAHQDVTPTAAARSSVTADEEDDELATPLSNDRDARSRDGTPKRRQGSIDDFFTDHDMKNETQSSLESIKSASVFEVSEIRLKKAQASYDENDEEVAEVMGQTLDEDQTEGIPEGTQPFQQQEGEELQMTVSPRGDKILKAWPKPPDVSTKVQGMATQVIKESTHEKSVVPTEEEEDEEEEEEGDEVVVEEEEEIEEEIEPEEEDDVQKEEEADAQIQEGNRSGKESNGLTKAPQVAPVAHARGAGDSAMAHVREIHREIVREVVDKSQLAQLQQSLQTVLSTLERHQRQMNEFQLRMLEQQDAYGKQQQQNERETFLQLAQELKASIQDQIGKSELGVSSKVEHLFSKHVEENQRAMNLYKQTEGREKLKLDQLYSTVAQSITAAVASNLEKVVMHEVRQNVIPGVTKSVDVMKEQIHQEMAQKLTATDSLLKDNIAKMVRSRQTIDAIGMAAGNAVSTPVQVAYRETFQNIVIPSFERTVQAMMQQVNDIFQKGTREYVKHLDTQLDQLKQKHVDARDPILSEFRRLTETFQTSSERIQSHVLATIQTQLKSELQSSLSGMQETVVRYVRDAVREEVSMAIKEQGASISDSVLNAMRSGAVTPVQVTPDPQLAKSQILQLLQQGQVNTAFQQALSAANLEMVIFACEKVNISQIFDQVPCPLHQPVLLSLIQQLSADLGSNTELKHSWVVGLCNIRLICEFIQQFIV
ncbi:hypothetical protein ACJMK2_010154 [Sinanodonta woodiana]|uniref:Enhancer of mRNA-decapping protein 4 n=1 Tax=Sinanodonta woodiana TaxID=1069815 RepID=A0ABD3VEJ0_SINWO